MEAVILSLHFFFQNSFFICFSFVIPFLIMFIFFHSAVYDDIIGCQNLSAINTRIAKAVAKDEDYKEFALYYKVEQAVLDLPVKKNINDEKIISQYEYCKNAGLNMFRGIFSLNLFRRIWLQIISRK